MSSNTVVVVQRLLRWGGGAATMAQCLVVGRLQRSRAETGGDVEVAQRLGCGVGTVARWRSG